MIDEKILLKALRGFYEREREYKLVADEKGIHYEPQTGLIDEIIKYVQKMPKVGEWIPSDVGVPEYNEDVEITTKNGERQIGHYAGGCWYDSIDGDYIQVIAWKEPSEPWEGEEQ